MDESSQGPRDRRGPRHDADLIAPGTDIEVGPRADSIGSRDSASLARRFTPPISALGPLFRYRFERIHKCRAAYDLDINSRATLRVLGGYYKSRRLVRVYVRDREQGLRPLEELFDTFLHE